VTKGIVSDRLAAHEPIHELLIAGVPEFHDDVVDHPGESRIPNERESKRVPLLVAMVISQGHHGMRASGSDNRLDRLDRSRRRWCRTLRHDWSGHSREEGDSGAQDTA
jgi:hypothetical protein